MLNERKAIVRWGFVLACAAGIACGGGGAAARPSVDTYFVDGSVAEDAISPTTDAGGPLGAWYPDAAPVVWGGNEAGWINPGADTGVRSGDASAEDAGADAGED